MPPLSKKGGHGSVPAHRGAQRRFLPNLPDLMNECVVATRFPGPKSSRGAARQIMSDPARAHLIPRHRTNASGAYSEWIAQVVTRFDGCFLLNLVFAQLVARPSQETWRTRKS